MNEDYKALIVVLALITATAAAYPFTSLGENWMIYGIQPYSFLFEGKFYTLITSMFTHIDEFHIFWNMAFLLIFGVFLAVFIGWKKFLTVYFIGGIAGGIAWVLYPIIDIYSSEITAVGASGAVFAVMSALATAKPKYIDDAIEKSKILKIFRAAGNTQLFFLIYNMATGPGILGFIGVLIYFIATTALDILSGAPTCHPAHLGGIISGALMGYLFKSRTGKKKGKAKEKSYGDYMPIRDYTKLK